MHVAYLWRQSPVLEHLLDALNASGHGSVAGWSENPSSWGAAQPPAML